MRPGYDQVRSEPIVDEVGSHPLLIAHSPQGDSQSVTSFLRWCLYLGSQWWSPYAQEKKPEVLEEPLAQRRLQGGL